MSKSLRIDFYKVTSTSDFSTLVKAIWAMPNEDARTFQFSDSPARLRFLETVDGLICGDMVRIRLNEPAFLAKIHGGERPITQNFEDEGLGETNAFIYCPATKFIAFQRNRSGISATKMAYYVEQKNNLTKAVIFEPVLASVKINQLVGKAAPKRLRFRVVTGALDQNSAQNEALADVIDAAHKMQSSEMEIVFSMGRRRGGMNKQGVINLVKSVLRLREAGHDVKALEVSAADEGSNKAELYDFIDATVKSIQSIEPSPLIDEFYRRRLACVKAALEASRAELL